MLLYQGKVQETEEEVRQALACYPDQFKLCNLGMKPILGFVELGNFVSGTGGHLGHEI